MQKRWAPPDLARRACAITWPGSISLLAFSPVSKWADWLQ